MKKYLLILPLALGAIACAPISEEQCQAGDWYSLGVKDGASGQFDTRVLKYEEECAKIGVAVDRTNWLNGRQEGLKQYCTITNAEALGRKDRTMQNVCANASALRPAYLHGLEYHELTEELDELKDERDDLRDVLRASEGQELTREQESIRRRYIRRLAKIEDDIDDVRRDIRLFRPYTA